MPDSRTRKAIAANVARILRQLREERGLSMNRLGEAAGLSQQMISYVERQMRSPTLETLLRITEALGVEAADVLRCAREATHGKTCPIPASQTQKKENCKAAE